LGIIIEIPGHLWQLTDNSKVIEVNGMTIRECLSDLARKYPGMLPELFDLNGKLAIIILKGDVSIDDGTIDTPVRDGDRLGLFPIIVGG
jgi:molybdopterin converting factor small subunit